MFNTNDEKKKERIEIFEDTIRLCKNDDILKEAINYSRKEQFIVLDGPLLSEQSSVVHRYDKSAEILVTTRRTYEAASAYQKTDRKVCVLNFANAFRPGGGVKEGCTAQEECLCRCSTLYPCITERKTRQNYHERHKSLRLRGEYSNLANDDCIYTPQVVVMKTDTKEPKLMNLEEWYKTDVITCAAPDLRKPFKNLMNVKSVTPNDEELQKIHEKRGKRILEIAKRQKVDVLILGAFGCGVFGNRPDIVACAYKQIIKDYRYDFDTIEFAIAGGGKNYDVFKMILENI